MKLIVHKKRHVVTAILDFRASSANFLLPRLFTVVVFHKMFVNKSNDEKLLIKSIKTITNSGLDTIDASLWENIRALFK